MLLISGSLQALRPSGQHADMATTLRWSAVETGDKLERTWRRLETETGDAAVAHGRLTAMTSSPGVCSEPTNKREHGANLRHVDGAQEIFSRRRGLTKAVAAQNRAGASHSRQESVAAADAHHHRQRAHGCGPEPVAALQSWQREAWNLFFIVRGHWHCWGEVV